jgi:hypothetical protein
VPISCALKVGSISNCCKVMFSNFIRFNIFFTKINLGKNKIWHELKHKVLKLTNNNYMGTCIKLYSIEF